GGAGGASGRSGNEACGAATTVACEVSSAAGGVPQTCASQPLTSTAAQTIAIPVIARFGSRQRISLLRAGPETDERGQRCAHRLPQPKRRAQKVRGEAEDLDPNSAHCTT